MIGSPSFAGIGAAHTYDVATGAKLHDLIPTDNPIGDDFGFHVAIADGVAIVGAPSHSGSGTEFGAVYLFDVSTGQQTAKLVPSASRKGDGFGRIVAVDHGIAMVGSNSSVYVFDVRTGAEIQTITRPDGLYNGFGSSLAFRDGLAVIGATSQGQGPAAGATYIYRITVPEPHAFLLALAACAPLAARRR